MMITVLFLALEPSNTKMGEAGSEAIVVKTPPECAPLIISPAEKMSAGEWSSLFGGIPLPKLPWH